MGHHQPSPSPTPSSDAETKKESKWMGALKKGYDKSVAFSKSKSREAFVEGRTMLERSVGLGHKPNAIPPDHVIMDGPARTVEIGWHPVGGLAGKWFAEETGLGKIISEKVNKYPDPTQHWAVLVGDYCHQLWMDEKLDIIYTNDKINKEEWHTYVVGETRFNDEALRQTAEMVIQNMRNERPAYNLITNNCQNFTLVMLDAIEVGVHREFGTTFAMYQRAIQARGISKLFADDGSAITPPPTTHVIEAPPPTLMIEGPRSPQELQLPLPERPTQELQPPLPERPPHEEEVPPPTPPRPLQRKNTVAFAQRVMDKNTKKIEKNSKWWPF